MNDNVTIQKNKILPLSQDYEFLRTEGLKHIENLSSDLWTDYNTHDPGITVLEALCYAITELGYRCGFDIKDLLHTAGGELVKGQALFTAKKILTINPLTVNDYRKLLVDINGIHNAWLVADDVRTDEKKNIHAVNEVEIFADCKKDELTYIPNLHPLFPSGLYRVLLDLDFDDRYGDLNNGEVIINNPSSANFSEGEFVFQINLPSWKNADFSFAGSAKNPSAISSTLITTNAGNWSCELHLAGFSNSLKFDISVPKNPASKKVIQSDVEEMFIVSGQAVKIFIASVFEIYLSKIEKARSIVREAVKTLHEHRNLCEDFIEVTTVDDEEIAFCFDVDVKPEADIEKVQAEIYFAIGNYLNPSVDFYSLKELLDKNIPVDEIYTGPILQHGFIDTAQLETTGLLTVIHTSDIINLLMDIEGVIAIRNFLMTKYGEDGKAVLNFKSLKWCMEITHLHKPVLSTDKSKILLFKNQFPFIARYDEVRDTILLLHAQRSREKLNGLEGDIPVPAGIKRDSESYWPIQYDFPQTYGIGQYGLPSTATPQRVAQQRQLKGYLMFYEQLLADFFSQLSNAYKLFSVDDIRQTYYAQFLKEIKDIDAVYNTPPYKLEDLLKNQDSTSLSKNSWQDLYEPKDLFEERRNRFLDHLLARFAESFNDYALLMYKINYQDKTEEKISFNDLSGAKTRTIKNYPAISSERGKAYNYFPQKSDFALDTSQLWDTKNVSGLEKRISFLTGIDDYSRRFLYCILNEKIICTEKTISENGEDVLKCFCSFSFTSMGGIKLKSPDFTSREDAVNAQAEAIELASDIANYLFDSTSLTLHIIGSSNETILESKSQFPDKPSAMVVARKFVAEFKRKCSQPVGLHLVEHILLRPRNDTFKLMQVCLHGCDCLCETDPYTFRASVVLPGDAGHFSNMDFREYFEEKIRGESPAHIMIKICWLNNDLMRQFDVTYKKWIETLAAYSSKITQVSTNNFKKANNEMIGLLASLHSEYPQANLHDCIESKEGSNPVMLGKTVLGTF